MTVIVDNEPTTTGCRYCPKRAHWSILRGRHGWSSLCHDHLGVALKRLGLTRLECEVTTEASVVIER